LFMSRKGKESIGSGGGRGVGCSLWVVLWMALLGLRTGNGKGSFTNLMRGSRYV